MSLTYDLSHIESPDQKLLGGKAYALTRMARDGLPVPRTICISTKAYDTFMDETALRSQVLMEFHRKPFDQMRWEEMWDCSLRIQNMFSRMPIPAMLAEQLRNEIAGSFGNKPVAVRSSAVGEDSAKTSFAGLHESYLNVRGPEQVLEHIKLVWASTWSDAAILYRKEIGLDVDNTSMAVVIQELIHGQESGVIFGRSPVDRAKAVVEAVHGLNQGLVDGTVEPDRWMIDRDSGKIVSHTPAKRLNAVVPARRGATLFGSDQDVEWTFDHSRLRLLQSRPITAMADSENSDNRQWYLTLRRSFENLVDLRAKIENEIIPGMVADAEALKEIAIENMSDEDLAVEISNRAAICEEWRKKYWDFCIPFAHGIRLLGMVYNRVVKPENPYEFLELLAGTGLKSVQRNERLQRLADRLRGDKNLAKLVRSRKLPHDSVLSDEVTVLAEELRIPLLGTGNLSELRSKILEFALEMSQAGHGKKRSKRRLKSTLEEGFLSRMPKGDRAFASELLDLARASYRLRDDDNIYLGQIEKRLLDSLEEARKRSTAASKISLHISFASDVAKCLRDPNYRPEGDRSEPSKVEDKRIIPRQLVGQPSGAGLVTSRARVISRSEDLFAFKKGEILVCDAVDPNMTFVVPMASAIVERRGGMLIHGAIIAREYGLPCVTGIPDADKIICTGSQITVDGYLGIVTINTGSNRHAQRDLSRKGASQKVPAGRECF
ncbi:MAG: PEP/pyruvate-binding domain-containing protein [Planctomycetota bacterium]|jgi:pyruvate,water dikinase